jgi:hypothetical protein
MPELDYTKEHSMNSLNIPNWTYQIKQIAGLYVLQGVDNRGHEVNSVRPNTDILKEDFFEAAQKVDRSAQVEAKR